MLASVLGASLETLIPSAHSSLPSVSLSELAARIRRAASAPGNSLEAIENAVGWELATFIANPQAGAESQPIMFLQAIAAHFQVCWQTLLVEQNAA